MDGRVWVQLVLNSHEASCPDSGLYDAHELVPSSAKALGARLVCEALVEAVEGNQAAQIAPHLEIPHKVRDVPVRSCREVC